MAGDATDNPSLFLWTMAAGRSDRRLALSVIAMSAAAFLVAAPFAQVPLAHVPAFIPVYQTALIVNDWITAALLFGQFDILRSRALFALAAGYLFTSFITIVHGLTFPGAFSDTGLLGAGPQTTAWLYMFWHGGFPIFVIAYALLRRVDDMAGAWRIDTRAAIAAGVLLATGVAGIFALAATVGHDTLPAIMEGQRTTRTLTAVVTVAWALGFTALWLLWQRQHSVLDLWLLVTMSAWIFDVGLSSVFDKARFDFGFYAGRIYGLLASSFVLIVLLLENGILYARLAQAHEREKRKNTELVEANNELDAFSYSVSHDLRTPLRVVDGYGRMLQEDYGLQLDENGRRLVEVMRTSSRQMGQLIDDLLALSKLGRQPLRLRRVDMDALTSQVVAELRGEYEGRKVDFLIAPLGEVDADPTLLKQAMINLVGNAVKFTRDRDAATIEIGRIGAKDDESAYFVRDNGAGFDMRYYDKLFGVFQRLHSNADFQGTGVGLAIVKRIINRLGGRVWAESKPNEGATFYFSIPAKESVHEEL